jgi:hypothetical protein
MVRRVILMLTLAAITAVGLTVGAGGAPANEGPLHYGDFFVVIFGIMTVLIGFWSRFRSLSVTYSPTQRR